MSAILVSLLLLSSPMSGHYTLLHNVLFGLCILTTGWKLLVKRELRSHPVLPILATLVFSAAISVYPAIDLTAALKDIVQIFCLSSLLILTLSLNDNNLQKIETVLRILFFCTLAFGLYSLLVGEQKPVWPFRNNYIFSITLCASFPFVLCWIKSRLKYMLILLAPVLLLLAPLSICIALAGGLFCSGIFNTGNRKHVLSFALILLILCIGGYSFYNKALNQYGLNDLAIKEETELSQRYIEWVAAGRLWAESPVFGVGGGNYQKHIGEYYQTLPKTNQMPFGSQNGWLILAIEYGIGGLLSFAALILLSLKSICKKRNACTENCSSPALIASIFTIAFSGIFTLLITRETGPLLFTLLGISLCILSQQKTQNQ